MHGEGVEPWPDARIAGLAGAQHGVVSRRQLLALGLGRGAVEHRLRSGRLHLVHRGVYAVGHPALSTPGRLMAAVLACGDGAVLSHRTAAAHWGLCRGAASAIEVTAPVAGGRTRRRGGMLVHRSGALGAEEVTSHAGIPVTTCERTLVDLAEVARRRVLERALDEAERLRLFDLDALRAALAACPGRVGAARLAATLEEHHAGETLTRSELEERFLELCRLSGIPEPRVNVRVGPYEVDFLWPRARLVAETDGRASHLTTAAFERDRERDGALTVAGYRVLRFTYRQVVRAPAGVAGRLKAALAAPPW